jgi:undecaprenyl-diphosphatase
MNLDTQLLLLINRDLAFALGSQFFPWITDLHKNTGFAVSLLVTVFVNLWLGHRLRALPIFLGLVLVVGMNDALCGQVIKPFFARPRPEYVEGLSSQITIRAPTAGQYGFVSNHAANSFCIALLLTHFSPTFRAVFFIYAALVAYSRVYCGVHFPLDVLVGSLVGLMTASAGLYVMSKFKLTSRKLWWAR